MIELKFTIKLFLLLLLFKSGICQTPQIALVKPDGTTTIHNTFLSAYNAAVDNDKIYLPGGTFTTPTINKRLHIYGVGWDVDSCQATGITIVHSAPVGAGIAFEAQASGGSITGVKAFGGLGLYGVNQFLVQKCYFGEGIWISNNPNSISLINCIIGHYFGHSITFNNGSFVNSLFDNNFIMGQLGGPVDTCTFNNNIFYTAYEQLPPNSTFKNNIFKNGCQSVNSFFYNNANVTIQSGANNIYVDNVEEAWPDIFIDPGPDPYEYSEDNDYHVKATSQCHNGGMDGTDMGIYGGSFPWVPGSIPSNPHIIYKNISGVTNSNGNLNINVSVKAQDN